MILSHLIFFRSTNAASSYSYKIMSTEEISLKHLSSSAQSLYTWKLQLPLLGGKYKDTTAYEQHTTKRKMLSLWLSPTRTFVLSKSYDTLVSHRTKLSRDLRPSWCSISFNPLRFSVDSKEPTAVMKKNKRGFNAVCYAAPLTARNLQWISTISSAVLMLAKGTAVQKSFLVPLFALQAPASIISWIKGEYGIWAAFLALVVRLFFFIPGVLELPFIALPLLFVAPYQVLNLRGKQEGAIVSLLIAGYLAFQHFSRSSINHL